MKFFCGCIAFCLLSTSLLAQAPPDGGKAPSSPGSGVSNAPNLPAHPITLEQTRELFELAGPKSMMEEMVRRSITEQRQAFPAYIPATVWDELQERLLKIDFPGLLLSTYQKYLSQEDAEQALTFYRTPAGRRLLAVVPHVMLEAGEVGQRESQRIAAEVLSRHEQEILDAKKKYDEQQEKQGDGVKNPHSGPREP